MPNKKSVTNKPEPEIRIESEDIAALIFSRVTNNGLKYRSFTLVRTWKSNSSKTFEGSDLFESNEDAILSAVSQACEHIRKANSGQLDDKPEPPVVQADVV